VVNYCSRIILLFLVLAGVLCCTSVPAVGQVSEPPVPAVEIPLIAFIWDDLFDESFDAGDDGLFIRSDIPASTSFGNGFELAVLAFDGAGDADHEYEGAVFIEHTRYPVEDFPDQTGYFQGQYEGVTIPVQWRFWLDAVSGRIVNSDGESRIVAAYVYVVDFEGLGSYTNSGLRVENVVPVRRKLSLSTADNFAFMLAGLETPRADIQDCADIDPSDVCALGHCQCENRAGQKLDDELDLCDNWGPISWSLAGGCGIAGVGAGAKAGAKRGPWGIAIGIVAGACAGAIAGELTFQSWEKGDCRRRAQTQFGTNLNWAMNEFNDCDERNPTSYNCPINP
jgi:hypothetical protein